MYYIVLHCIVENKLTWLTQAYLLNKTQKNKLET